MSLQNFKPITAVRAIRAAGLALSMSLALAPSVRAETALSQASAASTVPLAISCLQASTFEMLPCGCGLDKYRAGYLPRENLKYHYGSSL